MKHKIYVRRSKPGLGIPGAYLLARRAAYAVLDFEKLDMPCQIEVLLTDNGEIRSINKRFRDQDSETDVLSFPNHDITPGQYEELKQGASPETGRVFLGDIVISLEKVVEQGLEFKHGFKRELSYLVVHSALHLLGYDHTDGGERKRAMREREEAVLQGMDKM